MRAYSYGVTFTCQPVWLMRIVCLVTKYEWLSYYVSSFPPQMDFTVLVVWWWEIYMRSRLSMYAPILVVILKSIVSGTILCFPVVLTLLGTAEKY